MKKSDQAALFEMSCRGTLAAAFYQSGVTPTADQWNLLRGDKDITLRDIGEATAATGFEFQINFADRPATEKGQS